MVYRTKHPKTKVVLLIKHSFDFSKSKEIF